MEALLLRGDFAHKHRFGGVSVNLGCVLGQSCQYTQVRQLGLRALRTRLTPNIT